MEKKCLLMTNFIALVGVFNADDDITSHSSVFFFWLVKKIIYRAIGTS